MEWADVDQLIGVIIGGVIAGAVAVFLDARRRRDEREARREQWARDDADRRYNDLVSAYATTFTTLVRVQRHAARSRHPSTAHVRESPQLVRAANELEQQRIRLSVLAPIDTLAAFDDVMSDLDTLLEGIGGGDYGFLSTGVRVLAEDIPRFTALARRDIGHGDADSDPSA